MVGLPLIATDSAIEPPQGSPSHPGWISRRLYWGKAGAENWLAVVNEPNYPLRDPCKFGLLDNCLAALSGRALRTVVSLGPGDGRLDLELLRALRRPGLAAAEALKYIPVDTSRPLLEHAIATVQGEATVPVGICCDFEDGMAFLSRTVAAHAERPVVFAMLGGTMGNLDNGDEPFFSGMRRLLSQGDAFLIDVPLAGPAWKDADEPRLKMEAYSPTFRRFLAEGASSVGQTGGGDQASPNDYFAEWASFSHVLDTGAGAEVITVSDRRSGRPVVIFRRYRWEPFLRWLEGRGFVIEFARSSIVSEQDRFGMGVVLLTAPKPVERT